MTTPAGWYDDPQVPGGKRYWDGSAWTEQQVPPPTAADRVTLPPPPGGPVGDGKTWWQRNGKGVAIAGAVLAVLVVLVGISDLGGGGDSGAGGSTAGGSTASGTPSPASSDPKPSASATTPDSPSPSASSSSPSPTLEPSSSAPVEPIVYSGNGNKVLKVDLPDPGAVALMTFTNDGPEDNVIVYELDADLEEVGLAVNTIGNYKGRVLINTDADATTRRLSIDGAGAWKVVIEPVSAARTFDQSIKGGSDDVVMYTGSTPGVFRFTNTGSDSNVTVYAYDSDGYSDLLVNEIGKTSTEAPIGAGPQLLEIQGTGRYTIEVEPA